MRIAIHITLASNSPIQSVIISKRCTNIVAFARCDALCVFRRHEGSILRGQSPKSSTSGFMFLTLVSGCLRYISSSLAANTLPICNVHAVAQRRSITLIEIADLSGCIDWKSNENTLMEDRNKAYRSVRRARQHDASYCYGELDTGRQG